jgi:hypothetical protein
MEQAANHPWLQEAMRCHCAAYRLEAHGMRIEESDGGKIQITMALGRTFALVCTRIDF